MVSARVMMTQKLYKIHSLEALHIHLDTYVSQVSSASKPSSGTLVSLAGLLGKEGAGQNIEMQHLRRGR